MNIGIYDSGWGHTLGGAQYYAGAIAEGLCRSHHVTLIHEGRDFSHGRMQEAFDLDLAGVHFRQVAPLPPETSPGSNPVLRRIRRGAALRALSRPYDLFILSGGTPALFPCYARRGVLITHFPWEGPDDFLRYGAARRFSPASLRLRRSYRALAWKRTLASYDRIIANSSFTKSWIDRKWGTDSVIVYPPARTRFDVKEKGKTILSVGRFDGHKQSGVLVECFKSLHDGGLRGWRYAMAGGVADTPSARDRLEDLRRSAAGYPIDFLVNVPWAELKALFETASLFWHAKGFGADPESSPEDMEHFGIVTVEAMAAGCIPIAFRGGGQPEIVREGVDGFLWSSEAELTEKTLALVGDANRLAEMAPRAIAGASRFSKGTFCERFLDAVAPLLVP